MVAKAAATASDPAVDIAPGHEAVDVLFAMPRCKGSGA